jgi:molecular chaperone DnaK
VLTVPAHFDDHQRQATKDAAFIAGFNVLRVINEPTAASLAFGLRQKEGGKLAIFDLGGGTFDISVLEISDGVFHVLATNGDSYLGGEDFDRRIVDWLLEGMRRDSGRDFCPDKFALQRIKEAAEEAKRELSFTTEIEINVPFVSVTQGGAISVKRMLTRSILEDLTRNLVERPFPLVQKTLQESGLKPGDIDSVLLVGGQTRMPLVRRRVADFFQKEPDERIHPQESVALGAALQGGILNGDIDEIVLLLDVTSKSLGIETEQDGYEKIIEKNTTVPTKKIRPFTTVENNQRKVSVHVLQGEGLRASDNVSLARFDLVGIVPAPAGIPQIDVTFEIDADGLVKVSARDISSGKEQQIAVQPSSGLTKQQITNLVLERREKRSKEKTDAKKGLL